MLGEKLFSFESLLVKLVIFDGLGEGEDLAWVNA
jgi:hypothetical protein